MMHVAAGAQSILHVTEASGGGVLQVMAQLCRHQANDGARVSVAFTERVDTPTREELQERFSPCLVTRLDGGSTLRNLIAIYRAVRRALLDRDFDVIHLHSSYAGLAGRLAKASVWRPSPIVVYSPHAFGFIRADISGPMRWAIRMAESFLARVSNGTIAVSESEASLARMVGTAAKVRVLPNCLELASLPVQRKANGLVANIGRLVPQKGPERFSLAAEKFANVAQFVWIGGLTDRLENFHMQSNVQITGNIPHKEAILRLSTATVHLFTSKWEGMPLALMESQAMGIPAIAWDCPGVGDVILDGETGYIVSTDADMLDKLSLLLSNEALRNRMAHQAEQVRHRFSSQGYGARSLGIYRDLGNSHYSANAHRNGESSEIIG